MDTKIKQLLSNHETRFSKDSISAFEEYVKKQVADNTYDRDTNLALLKLYQFYPESMNADIVSKVLAKGLMNLPQTDFNSYLHILPSNKVSIKFEGN